MYSYIMDLTTLRTIQYTFKTLHMKSPFLITDQIGEAGFLYDFQADNHFQPKFVQ